METKQEKHPGTGNNGRAYNYLYYVNKFNISTTSVRIALREIRYGTPAELEAYLNIKYN